MAEARICTGCGASSQKVAFYARGTGWLSECKRCTLAKRRVHYQTRGRDAHYRRTYGITLVEYDELLDSQNGACAICRKPGDDDIRMSVDHDHATGAVRGILCNRCNSAIGRFNDDPDLLQRAVEYLRRAPK